MKYYLLIDEEDYVFSEKDDDIYATKIVVKEFDTLEKAIKERDESDDSFIIKGDVISGKLEEF